MASNDPLFDDLEPLSDEFDPLAEDLEPLAEDLEPLEELDPLSADTFVDASDHDPLGLGNMDLGVAPAETVIPAPAAAEPVAAAEVPEAAQVPEASDIADDAHEEEFEEDEYEDDDTPRFRRFSVRSLLQGIGACGFSMIVHVIGLVILGLMTFDSAIEAASQLIVASAPREEIEDPPVEIELQEEIEVVTEQTVSVFSAAPAVGIAGGGPVAAGSPTLDMTLVEKAETTEIHIDAPTIGMLDSTVLVEAVPDGEVKGEPRDIVDSYQTAMDRITQELVWMLDKSPVLVVWCFDQSESMKDDQQELRDRVANVYNQLGIVGNSNSDALLTAVTSYGNGFIDHTQKKPTSNRDEIRKAIDSVPIDNTGEEMMCQAIGQSITLYRDAARRGRQMAMILVTDESGNRDNNDRFLEQAIAAAKAASCKLYVLGRESVFGYPYAYIRWQHPETKHIHWLQIDRGPETAFPEQLQTDGFRRRHDAFSSGFGPYEQTRMARETNGVFFMLPSVETNLVGAEKHKYELEAMRPYRPDLRSRQEVFVDRDKYPLRSLIWKVISDLNPHNKGAQKAVELRMEFSLDRAEFAQQARQEQQKAKMHLQYMAEAEKALAAGKRLRDQEVEPRWRGNYDIIYAQLVAYQARIYEYGVALEDFIREPKTAPLMKGTSRLVHWDIGTVKKTRTEESKPYIDRATDLFKEVQETHPGTPWAARAVWEMGRGFGVDLHPDYHFPYSGTVTIKPPNL
ncbi:MAG: VWA domain-containing protein [Planctomycetaceae bacterium]|nr:VWA domain-containing protein [Planctomycetales bacterium]MCB9927069.1 VWA domain-containing protein [Planctomycetaceae bacterium]